MKPTDLILSGATVVTANETWDIFDTGTVVIRGDNIVAVSYTHLTLPTICSV